MLVPMKWAENGCKGNFLQRLKCQDMNCKRNAPTVKKKEKLKWVFVIGRLKFQGQLIARNDTLLRCFLFKEWLWLMGY